MSAAFPGEGLRRITAADEIKRTLVRLHPHVVGAGWLKKLLERDRIAKSIAEQGERLEYTLVARTGPDGRARCGVLAAVPRPGHEATFAAYGAAPMLFGFPFGFTSQADFDAVFGDLRRLAGELGRTAIVGPFEPTINYSCGVLETEDAFPLGVLMPENPVGWNAYFERFGFAVAERLLTFEIALGRTRFRQLAARASSDLQLTMKALQAPYAEEELEAIVATFNSGWRENWGFVPIDKAYVAALVSEFKPILWPGLSFIAYQAGAPVGILIATPDIYELVRRDPGVRKPLLPLHIWRFLVRRKTRAVRIFILGLSDHLHGSREGAAVVETMLEAGKQAAERYGAQFLQFGWTLSSNRRVNRLVELWAPGARRLVHRMYQLDLPQLAPG